MWHCSTSCLTNIGNYWRWQAEIVTDVVELDVVVLNFPQPNMGRGSSYRTTKRTNHAGATVLVVPVGGNALGNQLIEVSLEFMDHPRRPHHHQVNGLAELTEEPSLAARNDAVMSREKPSITRHGVTVHGLGCGVHPDVQAVRTDPNQPHTLVRCARVCACMCLHVLARACMCLLFVVYKFSITWGRRLMYGYIHVRI